MVVKNWFDKHKDIHRLSNKEMEDVIDILIKNK